MKLDVWLEMTMDERAEWKARELQKLMKGFLEADATGTLIKVRKPPKGYKWRVSDGACVSVSDGSVLVGVSETNN